MKRTLISSSVTTAAMMAILCFAPIAFTSAAAQTGAGAGAAPAKTTPAGAVPRTADGHPDLSGVWWPGHDNSVPPLGTPVNATPTPPQRPSSFTSLYQPWAMEKRKTLGDKDDPSLRCVPVAFGTLNVSLWGLGFLGQIVQTPKFVVMLTETYQSFRIIPTDGRRHRDDVAPSFRGDSVGHWEGDTLVVDETNFADTNWMFAEGNVSFHSDALHIVERYRRVDANTLEVEASVEDPKVLTGSWTVPKQTLLLAPFDQIMEVGCTGTETASLIDAAAKQNYGRK